MDRVFYISITIGTVALCQELPRELWSRVLPEHTDSNLHHLYNPTAMQGDSAQERHILHSNNIHSIIYEQLIHVITLTNCRMVSPSGVGTPPGHTGILLYVHNHNNNIQLYFT